MVQSILPSAAAAQVAADAQAKITGGGANYALQSKVQTQVADEDRFGQGVARQKRNSAEGLLAALRRVESKKGQEEHGDRPPRSPWESTQLQSKKKAARRPPR